jgi:hypothetical protein
MKKIDLGQTMNTLANVGVIIGIAFLALEINQNNRLLRAQAASSMVDARNEIRTLIVGSGEVADFWARVADGAPLSEADELRLRANTERALLNWQFQYEQFLEGNLSESQLRIESWRQNVRGAGSRPMPRFTEVWRGFQDDLTPAFIEFMEDRVINE